MSDFDEIAEQQGWTTITMLGVVRDFVGSRGLSEALGEHAAEVAAEENGDEEPMRLNDDGPDFDGHQPLTTENWVERAKAVERGESTEGLVIALTGPNSVTSGSAPEPVVTKVVRLMNGDKIIGQVEVYADPGTDPIQVAATALKGGFTAAEVDGERFTLDELDEWWA